MKTFYDNQIKPLAQSLDEKLGVKHIRVTVIESEGWDITAITVPVLVNYRLPNGNKRIMSARYIREMKMIGVLPQ